MYIILYYSLFVYYVLQSELRKEMSFKKIKFNQWIINFLLSVNCVINLSATPKTQLIYLIGSSFEKAAQYNIYILISKTITCYSIEFLLVDFLRWLMDLLIKKKDNIYYIMFHIIILFMVLNSTVDPGDEPTLHNFFTLFLMIHNKLATYILNTSNFQIFRLTVSNSIVTFSNIKTNLMLSLKCFWIG